MTRLIMFAKILSVVLLFCPVIAKAQSDPTSRSRNQPVKPFHIIGNIYYVGASDVTSYLITTPQGHILLDSGFAETVPQIQNNIKQLGFKLEDVKILINSHAHFDHAGGLGELKKLTGATLAASEADAVLLEHGGKGDFSFGDRFSYQPVKVDRRLRDKETIELGGTILQARLTPGHTKGCTTWTLQIKESGKTYNVVFIGSASIPGYKLLNNPNYPNIVDDYAYTFKILKSLQVDVFLASHGNFFSLEDKMAKLEKGAKQNPFIDPNGYREFLEEAEKTYLQQLARERQERQGEK